MNVEIIFENVLNEYREVEFKKNFTTLNSVLGLKNLNIEIKKKLCLFCFTCDEYEKEDQFIVASQILCNLLDTPIFQKTDELILLLDCFKNSRFKFYECIEKLIFIQSRDFFYKNNKIPKAIKNFFEDLEKDSDLLSENLRNKKIENILNKITSNSFQNSTLDIYFSNHGVLGNYLSECFDKIDQTSTNLLSTLIKEHKKSIPSKKWLNDITLAITNYGEEKFVLFALGLFEHSIKYLDDIVYKDSYKQEGAMRMSIMSEKNEDFVRSVVWAFSTCNFEPHEKKLIEFATWVYKKIPWYSALEPRIGAALMYLFSKFPNDKAILIFGTFKKITKYNPSLKLIDKYMVELAKKSGKTKEQMEDENIPNFDLDINGEKILTFGNITAKIQITSFKIVSVDWFVDQKPQKSVPSLIKSQYSTELKALQKQVKEIKETLSAQIKRVETFYLTERSWNYTDWNHAFHQHSLMSVISTPLIWEFHLNDKKIPLLLIDDKWNDENESVVDISGQNLGIKLWHPINASADSVLKWRKILQKKQISQPIKQAYREIYFITDAEKNTRNYSNRFAAHILKNYQFGALCKLRNWKGFNQFHHGGTPELTIKNFKIKVQYYVDFIHHENSGEYLTTDQVRFYQNNTLLDLVDIPVIVFSETLRDVDMFVGVCSIGNDPTWRDGGHHFGQDYWMSFSFGQLSEVAKTRKEILSGLLPKLKISKVSHIDGNFLVVKGKIRTYKIHLGSTNILMEPNDQYLCIVEERSSTSIGKLFIPFEGDSGLSLIISKALLLADDDKINDSTIIQQLKFT